VSICASRLDTRCGSLSLLSSHQRPRAGFFAERIRKDIEKWGKVARDIGLNNKLKKGVQVLRPR